jgi:hypothetical protein
VRGQVDLLFDSTHAARAVKRGLALARSNPPQAFFFRSLPQAPRFSAMSAALPPQLDLVTLCANYPARGVLLRLAHLFSEREHPTLALPVTVSLPDLFPAFAGPDLWVITPTSATGNQPPVPDMPDYRAGDWPNVTSPVQRGTRLRQAAKFDPRRVSIRPMDVLTFWARRKHQPPVVKA